MPCCPCPCVQLHSFHFTHDHALVAATPLMSALDMLPSSLVRTVALPPAVPCSHILTIACLIRRPLALLLCC